MPDETTAPMWDEATHYALGLLDGTLETYRVFNERTSDIEIIFRALLVPNTGTIEDLWRARCMLGPRAGALTLEPLDDWVAELAAVLRRWLFTEWEPRHYSSLTIETEPGRTNAVHAVIDLARDILRPQRAWRVRFEPKGYYALDWADVALESADRVLFFHFSCTD